MHKCVPTKTRNENERVRSDGGGTDLLVEGDEGGAVPGESDLIVAVVPPVVDTSELTTSSVTPRRHVSDHAPAVLAHLRHTR